MIIWVILFSLLLFFVYSFFVAKAKKADHITWGVNFSQAQAEFLKMDWKETYLAILDDLGAKHIKLITNWDWVEGERGTYYFDDIDWQIQEAEKRNVKIIYVVGMKTGRWPECHLPKWAENLSKQEQQQEILKYTETTVLRYKDSSAIEMWQAENEALFEFGVCPWYDEDFLKKEVDLIKSLDPTRNVMITDSGEQSLWLKAARIGDIVGTTMYRKVWVHLSDHSGFYISIPLSPKSYWIKSQLIKKLHHKKVINAELQAEPWFPNIFEGLPLSDQEKLMNAKELKQYIAYAERTGFDTFYFWGAEWWYWMKERQNKPEIWNEVKTLYQK